VKASPPPPHVTPSTQIKKRGKNDKEGKEEKYCAIVSYFRKKKTLQMLHFILDI
jgi:hypothetical protein